MYSRFYMKCIWYFIVWYHIGIIAHISDMKSYVYEIVYDIIYIWKISINHISFHSRIIGYQIIHCAKPPFPGWPSSWCPRREGGAGPPLLKGRVWSIVPCGMCCEGRWPGVAWPLGGWGWGGRAQGERGGGKGGKKEKRREETSPAMERARGPRACLKETSRQGAADDPSESPAEWRWLGR